MKANYMNKIREFINRPAAAVGCCLAGVVLDGAVRSVGLSFLCIPIVALLFVVAFVSMILLFWRLDKRWRVIVCASCFVLMLVFMTEMMDAMEFSQPSHSHTQQTVQAQGAGNILGSAGVSGGNSGHSGGYNGGSSGYHPEEDRTCGFCNGSRDCHVCDGEGGSRCSSCYASGDCKYCHGSGTSHGYGVTSKCGACNATGDCSICDGTGKRDCSICYGSGDCRHCY